MIVQSSFFAFPYTLMCNAIPEISILWRFFFLSHNDIQHLLLILSCLIYSIEQFQDEVYVKKEIVRVSSEILCLYFEGVCSGIQSSTFRNAPCHEAPLWDMVSSFPF